MKRRKTSGKHRGEDMTVRINVALYRELLVFASWAMSLGSVNLIIIGFRKISNLIKIISFRAVLNPIGKTVRMEIML